MLAQQSYKKRAATFDFPETNLKNPALSYLLLGHAPAQIHIHEMKRSPSATFLKFGENETHEVVSLRIHIAESG